MSDPVTAKLTKFIRDQVMNDKPSGSVVRFELRHLPVGQKQGAPHSDIESVIPPEKPGTEWYEGTAVTLLTSAQNDADGINSGTQRYVVQVFRSEEPNRAVGRHVFLIGAPDAENSELESEPATSQGVLAMTMRHLDANQKIHTAAMNSIMGYMARITQSTTAENEKLRAQHMEIHETVEALLSNRQERELAAAKAEAHIDSIKQLVPEAKLLAGAVINRMSGSKLLPQGGEQSLLKNALASLTDEQKGKFFALVGELSPTQQLAFAEALRTPEEGN